MKTVPLYQFINQQDLFIAEALQNKIFVYPTDTLYWIWGIFSHENIDRINEIKKRNLGKKLSIIAPSFSWIFDNFYCEDPDYMLEMYNKHHWVTYIMRPKDTCKEYSLYETSYDDNTIGVRIIKHPFQEFVTALGKPFISTSANFAGESNAKVLEDIDTRLLEQVDYAIDGKEVFGKPSILIYVDNGNIVERQ